MERTDFKIGGYFYTAAGKWLCVDVGTVFMLAIKKENIDRDFCPIEEHKHITIFDHWDFGGCSETDRFSKKD